MIIKTQDNSNLCLIFCQQKTQHLVNKYVISTKYSVFRPEIPFPEPIHTASPLKMPFLLFKIVA